VFTAFAVPTFTPTIDGTKDAGWGVTPDHSSTTQRLPAEFNLDGGMYVTDDNTSLYIGYDADNDPLADGRTPHIHIVLDVGNTAAGGTFACWGAGGVTYGFPFQPEFDIVMQWNTDNEVTQFTGLNRWDGFWNQLTELTNDAGGGNSWTELAIPKTLLGITAAGTALNFSMWLRPHWDCAGGTACLPEDADFPVDNCGGGGGAFSTQWAYTTQVNFGESDPPGILQARQIDRDEIEITFDEPMDETTLQNTAFYTPTGWSIAAVSYTTPTTVGLRSNFNFVESTGYPIYLTPSIRDVAGNSIDATNNSRIVIAADYGDLIVVVAAPAVYTCIRFKGSFNFYHEYDPSWSGGGQLMYDNGTNGDSVAGDLRHTLVFPVIPSANTFEWGAETCGSQWLIQGPNLTFTVPDGAQYYAFYEVPDVTTVPCDVTFRCDMQFIGDPFTGVHLAGAAMGWNYPGLAMSDGDLDDQYTLTYTLPAGSPRHQEFKYQYVDGDPDQEWESALNRSFDIVGAPATLELPNYFFNDYLAPPQNMTAYSYDTLDRVIVRWNQDYQRVNFEIFGHTSPDSILQNGTSLGVVDSTSFPDTGAPVRRFYSVRTVAP
jgi:hypothetical protein